MLNPDGVIIGNYRCSLAGDDLNRQWSNPDPRKHPEIYYTKLVLKKTLESRQIEMYVDCHGHSKKKNLFMYGVPAKQIGENRKIFPLLFSRNHASFSYQDCSFVLKKEKEGTARGVVFKEFGVMNSYTLEASFCGAEKGKFANSHFFPNQLFVSFLLLIMILEPGKSILSNFEIVLESCYKRKNNQRKVESSWKKGFSH